MYNVSGLIDFRPPLFMQSYSMRLDEIYDQ